MTLAKAKAEANDTFIAQASLTIVTYDCQNIFKVQVTAYGSSPFVIGEDHNI
jgi:hypothetical protein